VKVEIDFDSKGVERSLEKAVKGMGKSIDFALQRTALHGSNIITDRTKKGVGYMGKFAPYSAGYAKFRNKKGRQSKIVDFNFSGKMLASIAAKSTGNNTARIYFARATESKKAAMLNIKRPWFGFNQNETSRLSRFFRDQFKL
jgi:hypothetical protein